LTQRRKTVDRHRFLPRESIALPQSPMSLATPRWRTAAAISPDTLFPYEEAVAPSRQNTENTYKKDLHGQQKRTTISGA